MDLFIKYTESGSTCAAGTDEFFQPGLVHGLLRRQHGHRAVELRAELRDERQQLRHRLRAVHARRDERDLGQRRRRLRRQPRPPATAAHVTDSRGPSRNTANLGTIYGDLDPAYDECADNSRSSTDTNPVGVMTGQNIGDLLNAKNISWGWFQGGFAPTGTNAAGAAVCGRSTRTSAATRWPTTPAPQPVPVLRVHGQPEAPAAVLGGGDRPHRPGQPPVRPVRLLRRRSRTATCRRSAT